MNLFNFFNSTFLGNIIGLAALLVSLHSYFISKKTLKTADDIKEEIRQEKIKAVNRASFSSVKEKTISSLNKYQESISNTRYVSPRATTDLFTLIGNLLKYNTILNKNDLSDLQNFYDILKDYRSPYSSANPTTTDYLDIIIKVKNIIEKGEYSL